MVDVFLELYPELAALFNSLPTQDRDWLNQFCNSYKFSILIGKFLKKQLRDNSNTLSDNTQFFSFCAFFTGNKELINHLVSENSLNILSTRLGFLLLATLERALILTPR